MKKVITQVNYLDPFTKERAKGHLVIEKRSIAGFTNELITDADVTIDGEGYWAMPGFIDLHVHFREPGFEEKETLATGAAAALAGGYTTVVCMPNTQPPLDHRNILMDMMNRARYLPCDIRFMAAVTKGLKGKERVDFRDYQGTTVVGVTDDGLPVSDAAIMMAALQQAREENILMANHCEEVSLMFDRSVNQGPISKACGLTGVPSLAEELMVQRDLYLASVTNCPVHLQHISTAAGVEMIRKAKADGVPVTAEAAPHHFSLTEYIVMTRGTMAKMSPPLRSEHDMKAVAKGLADGTLDCIATDHAPHTLEDKDKDLVSAANGVVGLETSFAASLTHLVEAGYMKLPRLVECLSTRPAEILGLKKRGTLLSGSDADLVLVDLRTRRPVDASTFASKGRNTPFDRIALRGQVHMTLRQGEVVYTASHDKEQHKQQI